MKVEESISNPLSWSPRFWQVTETRRWDNHVPVPEITFVNSAFYSSYRMRMHDNYIRLNHYIHVVVRLLMISTRKGEELLCFTRKWLFSVYNDQVLSKYHSKESPKW